MSLNNDIICSKCGNKVDVYKNPAPTVDAIIYCPQKGVLLINRKFNPFGWALPGGFVDYGETLEAAVIREVKEETNLDVTVKTLVGVYSNPLRDLRRHTITSAFWVEPNDISILAAGDDAAEAAFFPVNNLPASIVFEHDMIIGDFLKILQENGHAAWR